MKITSRILTLLLALIAAVSLALPVFGSAETIVRTVAVQTDGGFVPTDGFGRALTVREDPFTGAWKTYIDNNETNYTGIVSNSFGDWYCVNGVVDFTYSGLVENNEEVWIIQDGKVDHGFYGVYEDGCYLYSVEGGKVVSKELKENYKNSFLMIGIILAIVVAMILSSKRKKKAKNKTAQEATKAEPIIDGSYSKSGSSIPKDHYQRPAEPLRTNPAVKVTAKPKADTRTAWPDQSKNTTTNSQPAQHTATQPKKAAPKPMPYYRRQLLTTKEYKFYKSLQPIADTLGLVVLTKIRMGDLVYPVGNNKYAKEWRSNWGRICSRHVDFALAKPTNMYIELLIELDDPSHNSEKSREIDRFKDEVYAFTNYKLLRVRNDYHLEEKIRRKLAE